MIALLAATTLTLADWTAKVDQSTYATIYADATKTASDMKTHRGQRIYWCNAESYAGKVATGIKKGIVLGTYEGTTVDDPKYLQSIQLDWEQKEKDAHQKCTS